MQQLEELSHSLNYYQQRQRAPGWQSLVQTLFSGILASAEEEESRDFLLLMGRQLAQQHPLPQTETVGELEDAINGTLSYFDWGRIAIETSELALTLTHYAYPISSQQSQQSMWLASFSTVLEGLYAEWLLEQGGHPHVSLYCSNEGENNQLVFCYKNDSSHKG